MNRQKQRKRILALLVAMAFTASSQAQMFNIRDEKESSNMRSGIPGLFWNGMNGDGNNGGQWNGMNGDGNGGGQWNGMNDDGSGGGAWWIGMEDDSVPVGDGLLMLAVSGVCYAAAKCRKNSRNSKKLKF